MPHQEKRHYEKTVRIFSSVYLRSWIEETLSQIFFFSTLKHLPRSVRNFFNRCADFFLFRFFLFFRLASLRDKFSRFNIPLKSWCFIQEARKKGIEIKALTGRLGYTNHFQMTINGRVFYFDNFPTADFLSKYGDEVVDDKEWVRKLLKKGGFPFVEGHSFWFFQTRRALRYGLLKLGFPLVVKPRSGSQSICVTTDIRDIVSLKAAIKKALRYSPLFIVERFIPQVSVFRATVVDFDSVFCVQQLPANVVGDGESSIRKLINLKNNNPERGKLSENGFILRKLVIDETTRNLLQEQNCNFDTIPQRGQRIWLQKDSFLRLGGDLKEMTPKIHPDNVKLFRDIAKFFDIRLVGIDFLAEDISRSWKKQNSAVLELNSMPCIEMHHFPSEGQPQNVARSLLEMVLKHY